MARVVMVGDQSSGKTSVVESLVGADISVKDQAMATRRPLLLTLIRTERGELWGQFRDGEKLYSTEAIKVWHACMWRCEGARIGSPPRMTWPRVTSQSTRSSSPSTPHTCTT